MQRGEKGVSLFPSPSIGHQALEPSKGHQVGIFLHLIPSTSLWKGKFKSLGALFFTNIIFDLSLENICSYNLP
jgi:hypothetical protein